MQLALRKQLTARGVDLTSRPTNPWEVSGKCHKKNIYVHLCSEKDPGALESFAARHVVALGNVSLDFAIDKFKACQSRAPSWSCSLHILKDKQE